MTRQHRQSAANRRSGRWRLITVFSILAVAASPGLLSAQGVNQNQLTDESVHAGLFYVVNSPGRYSPDGGHYCFRLFDLNGQDYDLRCAAMASPGLSESVLDSPPPGPSLFRDWDFSSDGQRLYFEYDGNIFRLGLDRAAPAQPLTSLAPSDFLFDGELVEATGRIVYQANINNQTALYSLPVAQPGPAQALSSVDVVKAFAVSDDGQRVVFTGRSAGSNNDDLFSVPTAGGFQIRLNFPLASGDNVTDFNISPASDRVIYTALGQLYSVLIDGGPTLELTPTPFSLGDMIFDYLLSPDGSTLAFSAAIAAFSTGPDTTSLFVTPTNAGGAAQRVEPFLQLTPGDYDTFFNLNGALLYRFNAAGTRLVYWREVSGDSSPVRDIRSYPVDATAAAATFPNSEGSPPPDYEPSIDRVFYNKAGSTSSGLYAADSSVGNFTTLYLGSPGTLPTYQAYSPVAQRAIYRVNLAPVSSDRFWQHVSVGLDGAAPIALSPAPDALLSTGARPFGTLDADGGHWFYEHSRQLFNPITGNTTVTDLLDRSGLADGTRTTMASSSRLLGETSGEIGWVFPNPANPMRPAQVLYNIRTQGVAADLFVSEIREDVFASGFETGEATP